MATFGGVDLELIVLKLLSRSPMHGYKISVEVERLIGKKPSNGSLSPLLNNFEDEGLISSVDTIEHNRFKKIYSITPLGRQYLKQSLLNIKNVLNYLLLFLLSFSLTISLIFFKSMNSVNGFSI